jgi:hypothetical protein
MARAASSTVIWVDAVMTGLMQIFPSMMSLL